MSTVWPNLQASRAAQKKKPMTRRTSFLAVFDRLYAAYGRQHWWPGESPFEIMAGAILTQNTAWSNVERAIAALNAKKALAPERILEVPPEILAQWIRPAGYFNVKAQRLQNFCRWYLDQGGYGELAQWRTEALRHGLLSVNGVGRETADDILLYAFARPVFVIDAYTRRIFARLGMLRADDGYEHLRTAIERRVARELVRVRGESAPSPHRRDSVLLYNEYHALLVAHGKDVCRTRPRCAQCCLAAVCPSRLQ